MDPKDLPGSLKVAILVQSLDKESAKEILDGLRGEERELVNSHIEGMGRISPELVEKVAEEFTALMKGRKEKGNKGGVQDQKGGDKTGKAEEKSKGGGESEEGLEGASSYLDILNSIEPDDLVNLIWNEHPQTIAIILVHLKTEEASTVLNMLSDDKKTDVAMRIAALEKVKRENVEEIGKVLSDVLKEQGASSSQEVGGITRLAEILNQSDQSSTETILNEIGEVDQELVSKIKDKMFVFEDLVLVDDPGLQKLLRKVETKELALALKGASTDVKNKIFRNMSRRAGEMLREEIEISGAVKMMEVENARQTITKIIQDLESSGELVISGRGGEKLIG